MNKDGGNHKVDNDWDSYEHIDQATGILVYFIERISRKFPKWSEEQKLKGLPAEQHYPSLPSQPGNVCSHEWFWTFTGGIAAYNMGDGSVHSYEGVDEFTTGIDYSNDVVARAKWFKRKLSFEDQSYLEWFMGGLGIVATVGGVAIGGPVAGVAAGSFFAIQSLNIQRMRKRQHTKKTTHDKNM